MPAAHWQFVLHSTGTSPNTWTWRRMHVDGTIVSTSEPQPSFGRTITNAALNGFNPKVDSWVVITGVCHTHFAAGQPPVTIPRDIELPARPKQQRKLRPVTGKSPVRED